MHQSTGVVDLVTADQMRSDASAAVNAKLADIRRLREMAMSLIRMARDDIAIAKWEPLSNDEMTNLWMDNDGIMGGSFDHGRVIQRAHGIGVGYNHAYTVDIHPSKVDESPWLQIKSVPKE